MRTIAFSSLCVSLLLSLTSASRAAAPYLETNGRVVVEAEHFDSRQKAQDDDHRYVIAPDELTADDKASPWGQYLNARGGKYLLNLPDSAGGGQNRNSSALQNAGPAADYKVQINTTGEYILYVRNTGYDGSSDSVYFRILELQPGNGGPGPDWYRYGPAPADGNFDTTRRTAGATGWDNQMTPDVNDAGGSEVDAKWTISKAGIYTVRIQQREDGNGFDAFILQLASLPAPTGVGPGESPLSGTFVRIDQDPKNTTVAVNGTATFTVTASGSSAVTYQWQKAAPGSSSFTDIAGATAASYTTGSLAAAEQGTKYRVNVSIPGKTATSLEAVVTVDNQPPTIASASGSANYTQATVVFAEPVSADTAGNKANYSLDAGLTVSDAKVVDPTTIRLTTSKQTSGAKYTVTVSNVKDAVGNPVAANTKATFTGFIAARGALTFEAYFGIPGNPVDELINNPKYPNSPDETLYVSAFDSRRAYPTDSHEAYGGRISGWLVPAETGQYELFIRSDDASQLFLSTDDNPANASVIAEETGCCGAFEESGASETSAPISLVAGRRYYVQALWKEGTGGDYCQVAWRKAGDTAAAGTLQPIPGRFLETLVSPDVKLSITQQPASATAAAGSQVTFSVRYDALSFLGKTASVQWQKNGVDIPGATSQDLVIPFANPADNNAKYRAVVSVGTLASVNSADATLTTTSDTTPPALTALNGTTKSVRLRFSEPLGASGADKANYSLDQGATVTAAKIISAPDAAAIVQLDVSGATAGAVYNVTINNVKDRSGNPAAANTKAGYVAYTAFYDFDDGALPEGTTVYGAAAILPARGVNGGSALMITPSVGSQQGGFLIPDLVSGAAVSKFTLNFKVFVGEGSGNPADGYSVSIASDVPESTVSEEGAGSGITVAFDTYDNGGGEAPAIDIKYAGTEVVTKKVSKPVLVNNRYVDVTIRLHANGTMDVIHNGVVHHDKVPIPGFAPISGARILMGARTGGEREIHLVDDLAILLNADLPAELPKPPDVPAPTVAISSPANNATFPAGASVTVTATASANGGRTVSKVEFFAGATKLGEATSSPYSLTVPALAEGRYTLTAKATDNQGSVTESAAINVTVGSPPETVVLVAIDDKQVWRYDRSGQDLGTAWKEKTYDDSKWPQGKALIADETGATAEPIRTPISRLNDASEYVKTFYFRTHFNLPGTSTAGVKLKLRHVVDDGVILYLNGVEINRFGIAAGAVTAATDASGHENAWEGPFEIPVTSLVPGDNVLAAEVHQSGGSSSDMVFGAELIALVPATPVPTAPKFDPVVLKAGNLSLSWTGAGVLQSADDVTGPWTDVPNAKSPLTVTLSGTKKFYRLK